jgi:hypothetical protein
VKALRLLSYLRCARRCLCGKWIAQQVQIHFDKHVSFAQYKTYSWKKVQVSNTLWESRIKDAVDSQLAAKGWKEVDDNGDVVVVAIGTTNIQRSLDTFYNGFGGGGWRWRGFGGYGTSTTTQRDYKEGTLVVECSTQSQGN